MKIAIASGKGGTGKTTVSTNLAMLAAEKRKVILSDLDVEEPNAGLFLKGEKINEEDKSVMTPSWQKEKCTLCGKCQTVCKFNAVFKIKEKIMVFNELCHSCYACSELCPVDALPMTPNKMGILREFKLPNLNIIEGKLNIGQEQAVPLISQVKDYVEEKFSNDDLAIFDSPPGTSCPVIEAIKDVDLVLLVTEPTPFGFHDLKLAIEVTNKLNKEIAIVINKYGIGNDDVEIYCKENNIPIVAKIPNDKKIAECYSRGEMIYKQIPEARVEFEKILSFVYQKEGDLK